MTEDEFMRLSTGTRITNKGTSMVIVKVEKDEPRWYSAIVFGATQPGIITEDDCKNFELEK